MNFSWAVLQLSKALRKNVPVVLEGPTGSGKRAIVAEVAQRRTLEVRVVDLTSPDGKRAAREDIPEPTFVLSEGGRQLGNILLVSGFDAVESNVDVALAALCKHPYVVVLTRNATPIKQHYQDREQYVYFKGCRVAYMKYVMMQLQGAQNLTQEEKEFLLMQNGLASTDLRRLVLNTKEIIHAKKLGVQGVTISFIDSTNHYRNDARSVLRGNSTIPGDNIKLALSNIQTNSTGSHDTVEEASAAMETWLALPPNYEHHGDFLETAAKCTRKRPAALFPMVAPETVKGDVNRRVKTRKGLMGTDLICERDGAAAQAGRSVVVRCAGVRI